jgi:tetratricopeptide (TPR) repeat protein
MGNTIIPQSLEDRLRKGEVVPFVGAGVSRAVLRPNGQPLFPGWRDLLLHASDLLSEEGKSKAAHVVRSLLELEPPDYLDAAKRARENLGALWPEFLQGKIDRPFEEADPKSLALAQAIWALGSLLAITTNYDRVLQWACPESLAKNLEFWDIEAKVEQGQLLRSGRPTHPTIWHLHGRIGNADRLILTPDGYERLYGSDSEGRYQTALRTFQTLLASKSLLFVGFSFEDDALGIQLQGMSELFARSSGPHYALIHALDRDRISGLGLPIELISFADFGEPLLDLLRELGEVAKEGGSSLISPLLVPASTPTPPGASYSTDNPPFSVPFKAKEAGVIGAEQALQRVRDQLTQGRPTSIGQTAAFQGLGGLGKTQLAVEYASRFRANYPNGVIWLTADQDIPAQLTRLAVDAKWVAAESEHKVKLDIAQYRIRSYSGCLIIFDNVEDFTTIEPYLPLTSAQPHLLLTSRYELPGFVPIPLDLLDEEQSLALLTSEAGRYPADQEEEEAAREVARELGGLPLALEMAGAYLSRRQIKWQQYRSLLRRNPRAALRPDLFRSFTRHEADIFATLRIQEGLLENEPFLREILDTLTWSGSALMGVSLLAAILSVEEADLLGALSLGVQLRLLERSVQDDRYSIHRLVRKVRQDDKPLADDPTWVEEVCRRLGDWFFARRQDFADLAAFEAEIDHLHAWRGQAQKLGNPQASRLTWLLAYPPYHRGQYRESRQWLDQSLALLESEDKSNPELNAWIWTDLGWINSLEDRWQEALEFYERALSLRRMTLGEEHPDTALSINNIGDYYEATGSSDIAISYYEKALAIRRKVLGNEHPDTAASLSSIGSVYNNRGDLDRALDYGIQVLEIAQKLYVEEHPHTATSLSNMGTIYRKRGDMDKALDYSNQALAIRRKTLGEKHPATAILLFKIGTLYKDSENLDKALIYHQQALAIQIKELGEEHPDTTMTLNEIGGIYFLRGNLKRALELSRKILKTRLNALGASHRHTITSAINVASALKGLERREEAFSIIAPYIQDPPSDPEQASTIKALAQALKAKPFRPGFRLPPAQGKKKSKKRRR